MLLELESPAGKKIYENTPAVRLSEQILSDMRRTIHFLANIDCRYIRY